MRYPPAPCTLEQRCDAIVFLDDNVPGLRAIVVDSVGSAPDAGPLLADLMQCQAECAAAGAPLVSSAYYRTATDQLQRLRSAPVPPPHSWRMATTLPNGNVLGDFLRSKSDHMTFGSFSGIAEVRKSLHTYRCEYSASEVTVTADGIRADAHLVFRKIGHARAKVVAAYEAAQQQSRTLSSAIGSFQRAREEAAGSSAAHGGAAAATAQASTTYGVLQKRCSHAPAKPGAKRAKAGPSASAAGAREVITVD